MPFRRIGEGPSQSLPTFESPLHPQHTLSHTCPCRTPALPLSAGCLAAHWLHSSRPWIERGWCMCLGEYWCIQWIERSQCIYALVWGRASKGTVVCVSCFEVIALLMCVQKAHTGLNACGKQMCAGVFACDSKRERDRRMLHARMCAGVFRQMTPYNSLLPCSPPSQTHPPHPHHHPGTFRPVHNVLTEAGLSSPGTAFQKGCNWLGSASCYVFTYGWILAK